jgi:hypothetical protein
MTRLMCYAIIIIAIVIGGMRFVQQATLKYHLQQGQVR